MGPQRETTAERLADVIHVATLARRTGTLSVERGSDSSYEEGMITFINGQVVQARTGRWTGRDALQWLTGWGNCRFVFLPNPDLDGSLFQGSSSSFQTDPQMRQITEPIQPRQFNPVTPMPFSDSEKNSGSFYPPPGISAQHEVPRQLKHPNELLVLMQRMQLPRTHRRLLLLVDGKRNIAELAHLMSKSMEELINLLDELERAGLIKR